jgi:hypothetical protein
MPKKPKAGTFTDAQGRSVTIKSDLREKPFKYRDEVPKKVLASQFDYLDEEDSSDGFIHYRGSWYHLSDFMRLEGSGPITKAGWAGYHADSFFSGTLIGLSDDGETYIVGSYFS